ncbi:hypothetical protein TGAM01_v203672 [Trichoderma gamsii]|uniref:Uncharacterized protein n=1 Tax=Trichoderma gamsii TaxID=398673 RepID=A0A2P4ZSP2_9HYPO|nr:hypothetical protein TGAM01_v203672 [Trichoderma gamsii]PON27291.1 hypothetical protein TGAM01_v203672 [Trichoderma gamsii]
MNAIPVSTINYKGISIFEFRDGTLSLVFPLGQGAIHTIGDDNGRDLVQSLPNQTAIQVRPDAWKVIKVLPRARSMYDHSQFKPDAPRRPRQSHNLHGILTVSPHGKAAIDEAWNDGRDEARHAADPNFTIRSQPAISGAYIGYSLYMAGPVIVRPLRSNSTSTEARLNVVSFNFKGNEFRVEPGTQIAGSRTIPHFAFTMPANLKAIKQWAAGSSVGGAFTTIYNGSSRDLSTIRRSTLESAQALLAGQGVNPVTKHEALSLQAFNEAVVNPNALLNPNAAESPLNPRHSELLCDGSILRRGYADLSGFRYAVPYVKALEFPQELTSILYEFTKQFSQDLFTLESLYLALYAWFDTVSSPSYNTEKALLEGSRVTAAYLVPAASLPECLVYYTHWLRWTEEMGLAEYPHFFRFIRQAVDTDRRHLSLVVNNCLDEARIKDLMLGARSKSSHINVNDRLLVLPHMMRDSHMPRMTHIEPYRFPTPEELLLTGLPSVKHCGTPTYEHLTSESLEPIRLCIPAALADNSFHGTSEPLGEDQSTIKSLVKGLDGHPRIITSEKVKCGRFWMLDLASVASGSAVLGSLGPPSEMIDPLLDIGGALPPSMQCSHLFQQRHLLAIAVKAGAIKVMPGHAFLVNERGFCVAVGFDVISAERFQTQPPEILYGEGTQEALQQMAMEDITFHAATDPQGPSPIADEVIATISKAPAMRHVIWNQVLGTLRTAPPKGRTPARLVELLQPAVLKEDQTWTWLEEFDEQLSKEKLVRIVSGSLGQRIRELTGLEASHADPFRTIEVALPNVYEDKILPLCYLMQRIRSVEEPEASKAEAFRRFMKRWKDLKRELKTNKLAPCMREYLDRLQGTPLPPKREHISDSHDLHRPGASVCIDLTMD